MASEDAIFIYCNVKYGEFEVKSKVGLAWQCVAWERKWTVLDSDWSKRSWKRKKGPDGKKGAGSTDQEKAPPYFDKY